MVSDWLLGDHRPGDQAIVGILKSEDTADLLDQDNLIDLPFLLPAASDGGTSSPASSNRQVYSPEDSEMFSDIALSYINEILMEEEMGDKLFIDQGPSAAAADPFIDTSPEDSSDAHQDFFLDLSCPQDDSQFPEISCQNVRPEIESFDDIKLLEEYMRGVEEASKFLPDLETALSESATFESVKSKMKNFHRQDPDSDQNEGRRSNKQSAVCPSDDNDDDVSDLFDRVLLCPHENPNDSISALRNLLRSELTKVHRSKSRGKRSRKKTPKKVDAIDLRSLLMNCAQAVATDDHRTAQEILKQIRVHASPLGDGAQRLAVCFADGLQARLSGNGPELCLSRLVKKRSAASILKAYHLYLAACPFKKISHFASNQTILDAAQGFSSLHIVDFGILFGFQWPCLIQRLSMRHGGPPKLKITGIEIPQPGFRPNELVTETGRRLKGYADMFNVPFEYRAVSTKFEDFNFDDLDIAEPGELLVVNCLYRFRNLVDETVLEGNPRDQVLRKIRKMNPDLFIHGVVNGFYGAPFFLTRFREALFHFSALFDMLEATVPREHPERMLIEREIFGREAINVVACEGLERVERPESYRQWQGRNARAGFTQVRLDAGMVRNAKDKVRSCYNKEFLIDEDGGWLFQGWKGRIIHAISAWRPDPNSRS